MGDSQEKYRAEWVSDYRHARRWLESRTVLARVDGTESLGKTLDVSTGGMKVAFAALSPPAGRRVEMAVVFADRILDLEGTVLHLTPGEQGSAVGLEFDQPLAPAAEAFLAAHYPPEMGETDSGISGTA